MNRRHKGWSSRPRSAGFSLVELMVAITIGAILLGGAVTLFISNRATYRATNDTAQLQENARFALQLMVHDIRMAGYFGCANDITKVNLAPSIGTGSLWDVSNPIEGVDNAGTNNSWSPSGAGVTTGTKGWLGQVVAGTDAVTVRFLDPPTPQLTVTASTANSITVGGGTPPGASNIGDYYGVEDCGGTDIFKLNAVNGTVLAPAAALTRPYAPQNSSPHVAPLYAVRYFVGKNSAGGYSLFRQATQVVGGAPTPVQQEVVTGVENMQILYGRDSNDDGAPDGYYKAGDTVNLNTTDQWRQVVSVRIALLMRTATPSTNYTDNNNYVLLDQNVPAANDHLHRRVFTTTAYVRNLH